MISVSIRHHIRYIATVISASSFFVARFVYAAPSISVKLENPLGGVDTLPLLVEQILRVAIRIGFPILVLAIVYTGFLFIKAQGNQTELTTAKTAFTWTLVGGAILLGALAIAQLLNATVTDIGAGL
ncbi:MAG: hypothetical protein HGB03_02060 [Candidatus Yonathbacteria bacterium]|nr:hypothetical protein [Candidatus Yonathbacteria bacterium]NTW48039.1 hypothetical protein [Candidatus Yonathbacteria bacterium]